MRAERERKMGEGQARPLQAITMFKQSNAALYAGQLCSAQFSMQCSAYRCETHNTYLCDIIMCKC